LQEERRGKEKEMVRAIKKAAKYLIFFIINSFLLTGIYYKGFYVLSATAKKWKDWQYLFRTVYFRKNGLVFSKIAQNLKNFTWRNAFGTCVFLLEYAIIVRQRIIKEK
jgi:hypothetical protein